MEIPDSYIIHDTRIGKDFKGITICGYKRSDVYKAFQNSMINNKLEDSIRWAVELHSTGLNNILWDSLYYVYFRYIHINNPKYFFYFLKREKDYLNIIKKYPKKHEIFSRNNQEIRNLYAELTAICSLTKKNNIFLQKSLPVINNKSFEKEDIHKRMISKDLDKIIDYVFNTTTNEIKLELNEIINNLSSKNGKFKNCIYWYLWIEKIDNNKKKNNEKNNIIFINKDVLKDKYFDHWIFILWNIILSFEDKLEKNDCIFVKKLHSIYKKNFKLSQTTKKKYFLFICFYIIKNKINWNINIFQQEHLIIQTNSNINSMYLNIINNIESNLSNESKNILSKKYHELYYNMIDHKNNIHHFKKIINTNLDEDINKVMFTNYPQYDSLKKKIHNEQTNEQSNDNRIKITNDVLVSKNMNLRDIEEVKEDKKSKKLNAFANFVSYKKEPVKELELEKSNKNNSIENENIKSENQNINNEIKNKSVIDYYNDENTNIKNNDNNIIKNITYIKK